MFTTRIKASMLALTLVSGAAVAAASPQTADAAAASTGFATAPAMPASAPAGYTRVFSENFNTPAATGSFAKTYTDFDQYSGCCSTNGTTHYDASKVLSASNGSMFYNLHSENGVSYAAAPVPAHYYEFRYGQVGTSVRLVSGGSGYKMAFLLWPGTNQWTNEVDFPEVEPSLSGGYLYAASLHTTTVNGAHAFSGGGGDTNPSKVTLADHKYHTFLLDWRPGVITASIDGHTYWSFTGSAVPSVVMHFVMQTEGWLNQGAVPASASATLEVPYVYINTWHGSSSTTTAKPAPRPVAKPAPHPVVRPTPRRLTVKAASSVRAHHRATFTGVVAGSGGHVLLQRLSGHHWVTVAKAPVRASHYRVSTTVTRRHKVKVRYRVVVSSKPPTLSTGFSKSVVVRVR